MNRKMRAKLSNAAAKRRRDCPNQGKIFANPVSKVCDGCGSELDLVGALILPDSSPKHKMN